MKIAKDIIHPKDEKGLSEQSPDIDHFEVETFTGKVQVTWDPNSAVTPLGQLAFFQASRVARDKFFPSLGKIDSQVATT